MVRPTKSGNTTERRDQVLIGFLEFSARAFSTLLSRWASTNGPLRIERGTVQILITLLALAPRHDQVIGTLVVARLVTLGRCTPRTDRVLAALAASFATAMRMVDRVHTHAAHRRADTAPALGAGLAVLAQAVF